MKLTNGNFYKLANGTVVKVQLEKKGILAAYNAAGDRVHECAEHDHVNGWEPCGAADFAKARKAQKKADRPAKKKSSSKTTTKKTPIKE